MSFMPTPLIVAHRGASQLAPENSFAAFDFAIQRGLML
jgi:glycerophosphoryl diester phosphodiesterase